MHGTIGYNQQLLYHNALSNAMQSTVSPFAFKQMLISAHGRDEHVLLNAHAMHCLCRCLCKDFLSVSWPFEMRLESIVLHVHPARGHLCQMVFLNAPYHSLTFIYLSPNFSCLPNGLAGCK